MENYTVYFNVKHSFSRSRLLGSQHQTWKILMCFSRISKLIKTLFIKLPELFSFLNNTELCVLKNLYNNKKNRNPLASYTWERVWRLLWTWVKIFENYRHISRHKLMDLPFKRWGLSFEFQCQCPHLSGKQDKRKALCKLSGCPLVVDAGRHI